MELELPTQDQKLYALLTEPPKCSIWHKFWQHVLGEKYKDYKIVYFWKLYTRYCIWEVGIQEFFPCFLLYFNEHAYIL